MSEAVTTLNTMWDPFRHAEDQNLSVEFRNQRQPGLWWPELRKITLRSGMPHIQARSVLAHELAHHHYEDDGATQTHENRADRWAANKLINPRDIARCALEYPENPDYWCHELSVTPHLLRVWLSIPNNYRRADLMYRAIA